MKKSKKWLRLFPVLMVMVFLLTGCKNRISINTSLGDSYLFAIGSHEFKLSAAKIIMMDFKCRYENNYVNISGEDFWKKEVEDGQTFAEFVKNQYIFDELKNLEALNLLAKKYKLSLTSSEIKSAEEAGEEYVEALNEAERNFSDATKESAITMMKKYALAQKTIDYLSADINTEISKNEARVVTIQEISVASEEVANSLKERIDKGEDFTSIARENSQDSEIESNVARGDLAEELEDSVFALESGEVSEVLSYEGNYYIIKCMNDYDEELSAANQEKILEQRIYESWHGEVESYLQEEGINLNKRAMEKVVFTYNPNITYAGFFTLYEKYFPKNS